ncbi:MAG: hypothetical protein U0T73_02860 [Chitinophagales bacterium]
MKSIKVLLLTVFYLLASAGVEVKAHYCHGRLAAIGINLSGKSDNCCCEKKRPAGCCETKSTTLKVTAAQDVSFTDFDFHAHHAIAIPHLHFPKIITAASSAVNNSIASFAPLTEIYLRFRVLRI